MVKRRNPGPTKASPANGTHPNDTFAGRRLRPHERVLEHLEREYLALPAGTRLPTAQEVADSLSVGLSTVQKVFRQLAGHARVQTIAGSGTYVLDARKPGGASSGTEVAIFFDTTDDRAVEIWQNRIAGAIMQAAAASPEAINIRPIRKITNDQARTLKSIASALETAHGIVIFPSPFFDEIAKLAQRLGVPFVSLHPHIKDMTANFVSTDYIASCRRAGEAWIACGRRRIALIQAHPSGRSASNFLRAAGMLDAINERLGKEVQLRIIDLPTATEAAGREAAEHLFKTTRYCPDAVFCMGDLIAHGFLEWVKEQDIPCPSKVSIISGTGMQYLANPIPHPLPGITATLQPLDQIGEELLHMLVRRLRNGASQPGLYLPAPFGGGATTTEKENAILLSAE